MIDRKICALLLNFQLVPTTSNNFQPLSMYLPFSALTTPLSGTNLIEASAGTGKTYSIAILALRLVLEYDIPVTEILMVTFTKAAVAELEERVRHFIRIAARGSRGGTIADSNINTILERSYTKYGQEETSKRLRHATLLLDELSVKTIHSFCQATLDEFAFETAQPFGATTMSDTSAMLDDELSRFWRSHITTLHTPLLQILKAEKLRDKLKAVINEHIGGKHYHGYDAAADYQVTPEKQQEWLNVYWQKKAAADEPWQALIDDIANRKDEMIALCMSNTHAKKRLPELLANPEKFLQEVESKGSTAYIQKLFSDIVEQIATCRAAQQEPDAFLQTIDHSIRCLAIQIVSAGIRRAKQQRNVITYDDLLSNLHTALAGSNIDRLVAGLKKRYKAVFIDEFQDTDRQQYDIFSTIFAADTIVCYIGDPKQSIYGWRKADMSTYFKARSEAASCYGMNHNFRSSPAMIAAMNRFFLPSADFDSFRYGGSEDRLNYIPVEAPANNGKGELQYNDDPVTPLSIYTCGRKADVINGAANQIAHLLMNDGYSLPASGGGRLHLCPSDIGVLVRTGSEGRDIQQALSSLGIPSVMMSDTRVMQSDEAQTMCYLLQAIAAPDRGSISRALLSSITLVTTADLLRLDDEVVLQYFSRYRSRWSNDGVYAAIMDFMADFAVTKTLLSPENTGGERILTNIYQLAELVHQVQMRKALSPAETIAWLRRGIEGDANEGDEFEQRVESDDDAVQITTIHKSKGLEYNIVFAPFMDLVDSKKSVMLGFRADDSQYTSIERDRTPPELYHVYASQQEQENARLLYVAVTRAVYKCYLFRNTASYYNGTVLSHYYDALKNTAEPHLICFEPGLPAWPEEKYRKAGKLGSTQMQTARVELLHPYWSKLSYTRLAAKSEPVRRLAAGAMDDDYDRFIFGELYRGAKTGDMLHHIFERISYTDATRRDEVISDAISRYAPAHQERYANGLNAVIDHVLGATLHVGDNTVSLSNVGWKERIAEFEFDFPVEVFTVDALQNMSDPDAAYRIRQEDGRGAGQLEGFMNGKVDLFFCQEGKYYILDWKSNYLGDSLAHYSPAAVQAAMTESNYHLQYLIYCVAMKKYLQSRLPSFSYEHDFGGVFYLFVRGVRKDGNTGIFSCKPSLEKISRLEQLFTIKAQPA
jgi:exodeoxyribonuclease V beta subunit